MRGYFWIGQGVGQFQTSGQTCCNWNMCEKSGEGMESKEDLGSEDLPGSELRSLNSDGT